MSRANSALLLTVALLTLSATATIQTWFCNNGQCSGGSCQYSGNMTENSCQPNPDGTQTFVKASCMANPNSAALCIPYNIFGPSSLVESPDECNYATAVTQHLPCGVCLQQGPNGAPMFFNGCSMFTASVNFTYDCNSDCSSCQSSVEVGATCQQVQNTMVAIANFARPCATLVSMDIYQDSACTALLRSGHVLASGLSNCNGYADHSNARASLFKCS